MRTMKNTFPDFSNKLVSVSLAGDDDSRALEHPSWAMQGGRLFLVGTVPCGGSTRDWCAGVVTAVAWDQVTDYLVFDSADHYRERLKVYGKRKSKG